MRFPRTRGDRPHGDRRDRHGYRFPRTRGIDPNLKALKRCALGLDLYLWLAYRNLRTGLPGAAHLAAGVPPVRSRPHQGERSPHRSRLPPQGAPRTKEDQDRLAELNYATAKGCVDSLAFAVSATASTPTAFAGGKPSVAKLASDGLLVPEPLKRAPGGPKRLLL